MIAKINTERLAKSADARPIRNAFMLALLAKICETIEGVVGRSAQ